MTEPIHVTCPQCDTVNRIPAEKIAERPNCGKCKHALFDGKPLALSSQNFSRVIAKTDLPVIVDFWAAWCGPCKMMAPVFDKVAEDMSLQARFAKLDTEQSPELAGKFNIRSIPTLIVFRGGTEVSRQSGALNEQALRALVSNA